MYAVVQIGSMILRSECMTTLSVDCAVAGTLAPMIESAAHSASSGFVSLMKASFGGPRCPDISMDARGSPAVEHVRTEVLQPQRRVVGPAVRRFRDPDVDHLADEHGVIAALDGIGQPALHPRRRI